MSPVRIAIDCSCLVQQPLTGVGYYTLHLLEAFLARERDFSVRLFASSASEAPDLLRELGARADAFRFAKLPTRLKLLLWLRLGWPPLERFTGPADVVHGAFNITPPARRGVPKLVTIFDLSALRVAKTHTALSRRLYGKQLKRAAHAADGVIAISQSVKDDVVELLDVPPERVHVVYGGFRPEEFASPVDEAALEAMKHKRQITGPYWIHLGTIEPRKNLPRLLEAYARLRERRENVPQLVLAGGLGWDFGETIDAIVENMLAEHTHLTGYLPREEAMLLLRGADGCTYPSLYEGFGLPVLEAMAAGVPVLTSNVSSLPEVAGDAGILVDPHSVDAIEAGLEALLDATERDARIARGRERAQAFTWARSAEQLAGVYRAHLANTPA